MEILQRDSLPLGGFQGVREHQLVTDAKAFGPNANRSSWQGIGNFVYLADARFVPHGETKLHGHREIDVISVMVEGRIAHEGSLEHGQQLDRGYVQAQRAGGEGFSHNEINPDATENRMIQLWVLPERPGEPAGYRVYPPTAGVSRVYGGAVGQQQTLDSHTLIDIAVLQAGESVELDGEFLAYLTQGSGSAAGQSLVDGDLFRGHNERFTASGDVQLIIVTNP